MHTETRSIAKRGKERRRSRTGRARERARKRKGGGMGNPTTIPRGTERRRDARSRARVMYADCKSAIMSLSRVYANPQHRRRSRFVSPPPSPPPRPARSSFPAAWKRPAACTEVRGMRDSFLRKLYRDATMISVDYAIIGRVGGGLSYASRTARRTATAETPKGYNAGSLPSPLPLSFFLSLCVSSTEDRPGSRGPPRASARAPAFPSATAGKLPPPATSVCTLHFLSWRKRGSVHPRRIPRRELLRRDLALTPPDPVGYHVLTVDDYFSHIITFFSNIITRVRAIFRILPKGPAGQSVTVSV